ncbi:MAG: DUF427 domain-containing protein [Myxococcales bacterium FL481]|nr:MAG: DUF427 domain-containing protein [Myxococcales bacterium FL481]
MQAAEITTEPAPYRIRGWKDGKLVVDTHQAVFARGVRQVVIWMFPRDAVRMPEETIAAEHDGLVAVKWDAVDEWWEEDERVFGGHPRDPRHRVDARASSRHVVVKYEGTVIAESRRPLLVAETHLPVRFYLPRGDVKFEYLRRSERTTQCPYKGEAHYYDVVIDDSTRPRRGALWTYEQPYTDAPPALAGQIGLWHEKLDVTVDGKPL